MPERLHNLSRILALTEKYSGVGFWEVDVANQSVYWTDQVFRLHGRPLDRGMPSLQEAIEYYHPDDRQMVTDYVDRSRLSGQPYEFSGARIRRDDGEERLVHSRGEVETGPEGQPVRIMGTFQDITERERARQRLADSEERFRLAAAGSSVGIWDWPDVREDKALWSDHFYELIGYQPGEIPASLNTALELMHPDDRDATRTAIETHLREGSRYSVEYRLKHKTQGYRWFLGVGQAGFDARGKAVRMLGTIQDIHDRHTSQQELADANRELERFAVLASHDLQEPLRKINQFSHLLRKNLAAHLDPKTDQYFDFLIDASERLQSLIAGLLEYSRLGDSAIRKTECDVGALARTCWEETGARPEPTGATLSIQTGVPVQADRRLLHQLLQNLLGNAVKYRHPDRPLNISISTNRTPNGTELVVRDNGIGFDNRQAEHIFEIFARLHRREEYEGTGLGLALCQRVMDLHGGTITARGEPGTGAVFTALFPD